MKSQDRVDPIIIEANSQRRQRVIQELAASPQTQSSVAPIEKDFHLVETALMSDCRVISNDRKMFNHLGHAKTMAPEICAIMWVDAVNQPAVEWLREGAEERVEFHICTSTTVSF